jgi:hypothetical protein
MGHGLWAIMPHQAMMIWVRGDYKMVGLFEWVFFELNKGIKR